MTARDMGGTTDRNSLSARHANGAAMLVEVPVDARAVARGLWSLEDSGAVGRAVPF